MRENRPSGSEGGVALRRHPYPYRQGDARDASGARPSTAAVRVARPIPAKPGRMPRPALRA